MFIEMQLDTAAVVNNLAKAVDQLNQFSAKLNLHELSQTLPNPLEAHRADQHPDPAFMPGPNDPRCSASR